jgi:hypothetical protein
VTGGTLDVLESLAVLPADQRVWPTGAFDARVEGDGWLLSTANSGGGALQIELTPDLLAALFQPGVANALNRADVVLELVAWDDTALANDEVAFGLGAINRSGQTAVGQVRFDESNLINLGLSQNDRFYLRSVMPQQDAEIELSMRRVDENTLGFFVDGKHLGDPVILFPNSEPITLVLYASGQGVQVKVSAFSVTIRPRSELP